MCAGSRDAWVLGLPCLDGMHGMIMYVYVFMNCIPSALVLDGLRMSKLAMCWNEVVGDG